MKNDQVVQVCVNQQQWIDITDNFTLSNVIEQLDLNDKKVAVAVNNSIVSQDKWQAHLVQHNDQISVFSAIAGG